MARVLLADDSVPFLKSLSALLEAKGYRVAVAANGHEAYTQLRDDNFDVLILDMQMPGLSGPELLLLLPGLPRPTPVIVVTGDVDLVPKPTPANVHHVVGKSIEDEDFIPRLLAKLTSVVGPGTAETGALKS